MGLEADIKMCIFANIKLEKSIQFELLLKNQTYRKGVTTLSNRLEKPYNHFLTGSIRAVHMISTNV